MGRGFGTGVSADSMRRRRPRTEVGWTETALPPGGLTQHADDLGGLQHGAPAGRLHRHTHVPRVHKPRRHGVIQGQQGLQTQAESGPSPGCAESAHPALIGTGRDGPGRGEALGTLSLPTVPSLLCGRLRCNRASGWASALTPTPSQLLSCGRAPSAPRLRVVAPSPPSAPPSGGWHGGRGPRSGDEGLWEGQGPAEELG